MSLWRRLLREAHDRSLWQVMVGYAVTGWIIFQVVATLYDALGLPRWVPPVALVLLLIGLPIVLVTAYVQRAGPRAADLFIGGSDPTLHPELQGLQLTPVQQRLTWRRALLTGALAFVLLGSMAAAVTTVRNRNTLVAQGVLAANDRVVLADFASPADSALGSAVAQALRVDLLQSNVVTLAEETEIAATLRLMQRSPDASLDERTARDVAQRAGYKAVVAGEIGGLGSGYTLSARLVTPEGTTLAAFREAARDSSELVDAVQRLSNKMREKIGESLKSIRASAPLAQVTTASLAALRKYTAALAASEWADAVPLLEEAIALDSSFAMAHRRLAAMLANLGIQTSRQMQALSKAYELRDRLPELERYHAIASYEYSVRGNFDAAIAAYQRILQIDSLDYAALNNIALRLFSTGRYAEAEKYLRRAYNHGLLNATGYSNFATASADRAESERVLNEGIAKFPQGRPAYRNRLGRLAQAYRWQDADTAYASFAARFAATRNPQVLMDLAGYRRLRGKLDEADGIMVEAAQRVGAALPAERLEIELNRALTAVRLLRDPQRAVREAEAALSAAPSTLDPYDRHHLLAARVFALAGQKERAEALLQDYARVIPSGQRGLGDHMSNRVRALIALQMGDAEAALRFINAGRYSEQCYSCMFPEIARVFDRLGVADSAIYYYDGFLTRPGQRGPSLAWEMPDVLFRLAELYETRDRRKAIEYYTHFIDLWQDADPPLQPRVRAAQARRAELVRMAG